MTQYCVLFQLEMNTQEDIIRLESKIRQLLQCESAGGCNILQTAPYKRLITALLLRMNNIISFEERITIYLGFNDMSLVMQNDAKTVEIRSRMPSHPSEIEMKRPRIEETEKQQVEAMPVEGKRRRKYSRQKQEDCFVSKFLLHKTGMDPQMKPSTA